jgi:alkylation response protein AidB-like acyl-CoA dehydrogenase
MAMDLRGRGGRSINEAWRDAPTSYLGITTAGFPNMFMVLGPGDLRKQAAEMGLFGYAIPREWGVSLSLYRGLRRPDHVPVSDRQPACRPVRAAA